MVCQCSIHQSDCSDCCQTICEIKPHPNQLKKSNTLN